MRKRSLSNQAREVLVALARNPAEWRHGYDLSRLTGLSSGTLYPLLIRLHERGVLEARWDAPERAGRPPRHAYRLTAEGVRLAVEPRDAGRLRASLEEAPA